MKLTEYIKDTRGELKHVSWPTRKQSIAYTIIVVAISLVVSFYLGFLDAMFSRVLEYIVS